MHVVVVIWKTPHHWINKTLKQNKQIRLSYRCQLRCFMIRSTRNKILSCHVYSKKSLFTRRQHLHLNHLSLKMLDYLEITNRLLRSSPENKHMPLYTNIDLLNYRTIRIRRNFCNVTLILERNFLRLFLNRIEAWWSQSKSKQHITSILL